MVSLTTMVLYFTVTNFTMNTSFRDLVSKDMDFRKIKKDYDHAFPQFTDTIVVVTDADTPENAMLAHDQLTHRLKQNPDLFKTVYQPGGGDFFKKNGLLYKNTDELEDLADNLADVQPFLALISKDFSIQGLFSVLEDAINENDETEVREKRLTQVLNSFNTGFQKTLENRFYALSWRTLMLDEEPSILDLRKFIVLQPATNLAGTASLKEAFNEIRQSARDLEIDENRGFHVRITGSAALNYENFLTVRKSIASASLISLLLVTITLAVGLGSVRLVVASLITLITGLILTSGFALAFIGQFNMISVTFAVLFIGLGIDYSIQFCLRYRELVEKGMISADALMRTAQGVGKSLLLCTLTTSVGFFAFVPTAYTGVSELGLISGIGMFINFFTNLTVLPAILCVAPFKKGRTLRFAFEKNFTVFPYKYSKAVIIVAVIAGLGAASFLPGVLFNFNPLTLYNQKAESVATALDLFKYPETSPWTAADLALNMKDAEQRAKALDKLEEVEMTLTIADFIPEEQEEKLEIISDISLFMPKLPDTMNITPLTFQQKNLALNSFESELKNLVSSKTEGTYYTSAIRLLETIGEFKKAQSASPGKGAENLDSLEKGLLSNLPILLKHLEGSLQADMFGEADLPREIYERFVSQDNRYRIQIFPSENITHLDALTRFVSAVRTVAQNATAAPVVIRETGKAIVASFKQASLSALIVIGMLLFIVVRSISGTILILVPLLLAVLLTAAASVLLDIPFNYANVIVVPLLLGIGVDNGIHFIHRFQTEPPEDGNMLKTSTSRGVLFSSLTTIMSFSSLSFLSHQGTASMGKLLTVCMTFLILNTLILLPALLNLFATHLRKSDRTSTQ
jgi:hopanoid biosynthesis associated RND transporter like protein HpnN